MVVLTRPSMLVSNRLKQAATGIPLDCVGCGSKLAMTL
jgi:hypothetical protein